MRRFAPERTSPAAILGQSLLDKERHSDGRGHADLTGGQSAVIRFGRAAGVLGDVLKHLASVPAPKAGRRAPPTTPVVRTDVVDLAKLHAELERQCVGLFPGSSNRQRARGVAVLS